MMHRNLEEIRKNRRDEAAGWGIRETGAAEEGGKTRPGTVRLRMVVAEDGKIRNAHGYEGNLEEGLARYEAEVGPSSSESPPAATSTTTTHLASRTSPAGYRQAGNVAAKRKRANRQDEDIDLSWAYEAAAAARAAEEAAQATLGQADGGATGPQPTETAEETLKADDETMSQGAQAGPGFAAVAEMPSQPQPFP